MPVLSFTPADALSTVVVENGTYTATIVKIEGPKASQSGKSNNMFFTFQIVQEGKYKGKELDIIINSEMDSASVLGSACFFPQAVILQIDAAIKNKKVEIANTSIDTDDLMDKPLDIVVAVSTVEGKLINVVNNFLPAGSGLQQPGW